MYKSPLNCNKEELAYAISMMSEQQTSFTPFATGTTHYQRAAITLERINNVTGKEHATIGEFLLSVMPDDKTRNVLEELLQAASGDEKANGSKLNMFSSGDYGNIALIIVDIQNDFCHDDGLFAQQGLNVKPAQEVTPRIKAFIDEVRKYGIPVIYTRQIESEEVSPDNLKRQFASGKLKAVCAQNSWGSELYRLEPAEGEYVIEKHTYDAFSNPRLKQILEKKGVDTLVIAGVNTDICIDTTVRRAFTEGYDLLIPRDLVATMNVDGEKHFLDVFDMFFGDVVSSGEVLEYLRR